MQNLKLEESSSPEEYVEAMPPSRFRQERGTYFFTSRPQK